MDKESKLISGLKLKQTLPSGERRFSEEEKHFIINEYLTSIYSKQYIWEKYTGYQEEHGQLGRWMRKLGYKDIKKKKYSPNFAEIENHQEMKIETQENQDKDFEKLQLEKRIAELEKQLKEAELKAIAFSTMIDIAEKELKISIKKKFNTKLSNK